MCIALLSTAHPRYPLILLSNRDEYLARRTAPLAWWQSPANNTKVLSGRDLQRSAKGAWLGITECGRLAVLTNFREEPSAEDAKAAAAIGSRGEITNRILTSNPDRPLQEIVGEMIEGGVQGVGGFSLVFCDLDPKQTSGQQLGVISNRTNNDKGILWIDGKTQRTVALSNSHYGDQAWPKVVDGERLLNQLLAHSAEQGDSMSQDELISSAFALLSTDSLPRREAGEQLEMYLRQLRKSIFIPTIGGEDKPAQDLAAAKSTEDVQGASANGDTASPLYGTQKQSVILVAQDGHVTFVERTLFDDQGQEVNEDRRFEFDIGR